MKYYTFKNVLFDDSQFAFGEQRELNFNTGDAKSCRECGNPVSMLKWLPPYEVTVSKKKLGDFIYGTYVGFIVSQRVKDKIEHSSMKGLDIFENVDLYYKGTALQDDYFYPEIPLINAFIDLQRVELDGEALCNTCQKGGTLLNKINGIYFSNAEQIKEDIFFTTSLGQATIIISENFKNIIELNNFTNVDLIEVSQYKWDCMNP